MATWITLTLSDPTATTGIVFADLATAVPLPSSASWIGYGNEQTNLEPPSTTLVTLQGHQFLVGNAAGTTSLLGNIEVAQVPLVTSYTPQDGYTFSYQYFWTRNDHSTISFLTYDVYLGAGFFLNFLDTPQTYSQVADVPLIDFIGDGTVIVGTHLGDTLSLTDHDETVLAGVGDDLISAAGGNDTVLGEDGNDVMRGGPGNDHLDGGAGTDTIDYSGITGVNLNLAQGRAVIGSEVDTLVAIEKVIGSNSNDVLIGDTSDNNLTGGLGDDRLDGGGGSDVLSGGQGGDRLDGGAGNDGLGGDNGDDWLFGGAGDDTLEGGVGADRLYGGDGNDRLIGGPAADRLTGGAGADSFVLLTPFDGPDQFLDFTSGEDKFEFNADGFSLGISGAILTPTADPHVWEFLYVNGADILVYATLSYDAVSGWLRWDWTQADPSDAVHLATLPGADLTINDFVVA